MASPSHPYTPEFHAKAVRLLRSGDKTVAELSRELGVSEATLRRWRQQADEDAPQPARRTNDRGKDQSMRALAKLTADVIETGVAVVTFPARWTVNGLRWYAARDDDSATRTGNQTGGA